MACEVNFDGLVGPTHNYAGLSYGNVASTGHAQRISNPKLAALQGLAKMKALADLGFAQGVLAPHERPALWALRALGFGGDDAQILAQAAREAPAVLAACSSASAMWVANAATVSPSADTVDGRVHFTPANLNNKFHRALEHSTTGRMLAAMFPDARYFAHHAALPAQMQFGDEGAANHTRFCGDYGQAGLAFFVYGVVAFSSQQPAPQRYPARQTLEASQAIARKHGVPEAQVVFAQQHPQVIDAGVFHNDVIAVGNQHVLLHHEQAFLEQQRVLDALTQKSAALGHDFVAIEVPTAAVSVEQAVQSYLFNSQLLTKPNGKMLLVLPEECRHIPAVWEYIQTLCHSQSPIDEWRVFDLKQSMQNGGGPACLRLRVALTAAECAAVNPAVLMTDTLYSTLCTWVERHYRDRLRVTDLADPQLLRESRIALDELTQILQLGAIYPFQRGQRDCV